ncbi:MAG: ABC transporter substrate-binding protein [Vicinamibacterales bacterium]
MRFCRGTASHAAAVRRGLLAATASASVLASGACQAPPIQSPPPATTVVRVGIAQPVGVPSTAAAVSQVARRLTFATLVTVAPDSTIQPGLASRFEVSADGRRWLFELRPGLRFTDGSPLDATVVAGILDRILRGGDLGPGLQDITHVEAIGPATLAIDLRAQSSLLPEALAVVSIERLEAEPATAGPYRRLANDGDWTPLEAFAEYYRGRPSIDRVELRGYPTSRAAWVALMRDEIDLLYDVPTDAAEFVEASSNIQSFSFLRPFVQVLGFNVATPALRDARVRRAIALAVDREAIISQAFSDRATPATGAVWLRHWARQEQLAVPAGRHVEQARRLIAEATGMPPPLRANESIRRVSCLLPAGYPVFERTALVLQRQLLDIGIDLRPEVLPVGELTRRLGEGRFETYLFEQNTGLGMYLPYLFWHSPGPEAPLIRHGYTGADPSLDRVLRAENRNALGEAIREFQRAMADDPPAVFLAWTETARAVRRRFVIPDEPDRDVFASLPQWKPSGAAAP